MHLQKVRKQGQKLGFLIFKCSNGKYYKTDVSGMQGVKEMTTWQRKIDKDISSQMNLL